MMRAMKTRLLALALLAGCGSSSTEMVDLALLPDLSSVPDYGPRTASVSGDAIPFDLAFGSRIEGAVITILEHPDRKFTTGADGHFRFDFLEIGKPVTLVLTHPDWPTTQTGTHVLPAGGIERLTFQVPTPRTYDLLAGILGVTVDKTRCQMVTTVTRVGKSLYDPGAHGEADATVALTPAAPAEAGPVYFNASVIPDRSLTRSSDDGGVVWTNVPPGTYTLTTAKAGVTIRDVTFTCRAGVLVNASPPWGAQVL